MEDLKGIIVKAISGFFYVNINGKIVECRARGKFKHKDIMPVVGDYVKVDSEKDSFVVEEIAERRNYLVRPLVANITQAFLVFAIKNPNIDLELFNKLILISEYNKINIIIIINKMDLYDESLRDILNRIMKYPYEIKFISREKDDDYNYLKSILKDNTTMLSGPSGAGKSTLFNKLTGYSIMETSEISKKSSRGKHTTRHCELVESTGGFLVDTPGFSSVSLDLSETELRDLFNEFDEYSGYCKYNGCMHYREPKCMVKEAVESSKISRDRYEFYVKTLEELKGRKIKW